MPVLEERACFASAGGEGAPCQCWGRGRALPILDERPRLASAVEEGAPCQCLGNRARLVSAGGEGTPYLPMLGESARTLLVLQGDWVHLANDGGEDAPW